MTSSCYYLEHCPHENVTHFLVCSEKDDSSSDNMYRNNVVQNDAQAKGTNSICTYSVATQSFHDVILLNHILYVNKNTAC